MPVSVDLCGRVAVVTGGNMGIGRATALALAQCGADVAILDPLHLDSDTADLVRAAGVRCLALPVDVTRSDLVEKAFDQVVDDFGRIDILVNNVGGPIRRARITEVSDELWDQVLALNVTSAMYCARAAARTMTAERGRIVNITSLGAQSGGVPGALAYVTAKAAVVGLTRALAKDLAPGITVNAVSPGVIFETLFQDAHTTKEDQQRLIDATLVKRKGLPPDVAAAIVYLASDDASFITGSVLNVNGGAYFSF